jgi:hypothetical protein
METLIIFRDERGCACNMSFGQEYSNGKRLICLRDIDNDEQFTITEEKMVRYIQWIIAENLKKG